MSTVFLEIVTREGEVCYFPWPVTFAVVDERTDGTYRPVWRVVARAAGGQAYLDAEFVSCAEARGFVRGLLARVYRALERPPRGNVFTWDFLKGVE